MMNPAILQPRRHNPMGQPYIGPDITSRTVAGVIRRVAQYTKGNKPVSYLVQLYPNEGGENLDSSAIVPADLVREHLADLALVASMEKDSE